MASMTLEEKAGQLVMVMAYGHYLSAESDEYARMVRLVRERNVGGVVLSHSDVYETAIILNRLQSQARIPLLVSADLERGLAMRVRRGTSFPDAMAIGATRKPEYAYAAGRAIAEEARAVGIHQNFAPVADVNSNPANPVINTRSFGDDLPLVNSMVAAFIRGTNEGGCISTTKHFPGHGDTGTDSHLELPVLPYSRKRLDSLELAPFRNAIQSGTKSVMIAHLAVPALNGGSEIPASLSPGAITSVLRREMAFEGLVITDAMDMRGVARGYSVAQSTVMALQAGVDIVLLPPDNEVAINAIISAVKGGGLAEVRVDASVRKILETKRSLGLDRTRTVNLEDVSLHVASRAHTVLAREIARDAITLLRNRGNIIPLNSAKIKKILTVVVTDTDEGRTDVNRPSYPYSSEPAGAYFSQLIGRRVGNGEVLRLTPGSDTFDVNTTLKKMKRADLVLMPLYVKVRTSSGRIGIPKNLQAFLSETAKLKRPTVTIAFGNPYLVSEFPHADALVCAYADEEVLVEAAVEALFGETEIRGKLPVDIPGSFPFGAGIAMEAAKLRKGDSFLAGFDPARLRRIDSIITAAIRDSAFPGAEVAVVRNGAMVWNRAYGTTTYDVNAREVTTSTIFDLASLTKVIATTSAVMKLYDRGELALDDPVSKYIPQFASGPKASMTIRHLLLHRGGFPPFRKFWEMCRTQEEALDSLFATQLVARPGDSTIYSDLGFMTLGKVVERIAGMPLSDFVKREFFDPLQMKNTMYKPPADLRELAAPTEVDTIWRRRLVRGTVHDENAELMGGVSGHAGLFSTAADLAVYMQMLLNGGTYGGIRLLSDSTVREFTRKREDGQERFLGWDGKSLVGSSAGSLFSPSSFGHTGFTGTCAWVDPERNLAVVFLANRVYPTRANTKIFKVRPALNDAVVSSVSGDGR
jgi:beta-glucosidase-like glycosyl hydrolase/CubicO group peptidase (beta-lactamase class C family)